LRQRSNTTFFPSWLKLKLLMLSFVESLDMQFPVEVARVKKMNMAKKKSRVFFCSRFAVFTPPS
jgi:hypothetical protein